MAAAPKDPLGGVGGRAGRPSRIGAIAADSTIVPGRLEGVRNCDCTQHDQEQELGLRRGDVPSVMLGWEV